MCHSDTLQLWHDRLCEEFINGNCPLWLFLELDEALEKIKPLYETIKN